MSDLISRQAAIDAVKRLSFGETNAVKLTFRILDYLERLTSAQTEIILCKDCKYQRKGQNECEAWNLCGYRPWQYTPITDEHFCSYAERRTDE